MPTLRSLASGFLAAVGVALASAAPARADGDADDFRANCASCHTIGGGRITGPDLKGVTTRRPKEWLVGFIRDPKGVIDSGDPYAARLLADARGVLMPNIAGMTAKRAEGLLALIEAESKLEKSVFATSGVSDRAFTPEDIARGREIFLGSRRLAAGGVACISCHVAGEMPWLGGGRLGPDLTDAYARLEGRKALGAWLVAPPTATMKPLFAPHPLDAEQEILPLLAFLEDVARRPPPASAAPRRLAFVLVAAGAAGVFLVLLDRAWRRRFRGVRRRLVESAS
jgi:mono/diheme cytochrome c family protein